jgi:hypothetical protein
MRFVLRLHGADPERPLYLHKSVSPERRHGVSSGALRFKVTKDIGQARVWRTPEGAAKYAARPTFGIGTFTVERVA